jgi:hypothetical protein
MKKHLEEKRIQETSNEEELLNRRSFLVGLKKWSKIVISGALGSALLLHAPGKAEAGWINNRGGGGGWMNGGGGGGWANNRGGGGWINRR